MVSDIDHKASKRMAATVAGVVAVFAAAFIGLVLFLDSIEIQTLPEPEVELPAPDLEIDPESSLPEVDTQNPYEEPFYVLLIGSDSRKGTVIYTGDASEHAQVDQHADSVVLVRVDTSTFTITLVTVPEDTILDSSGIKVSDYLLENDPEEVVEAVEELTGVEISYYVMTSFLSFQDIVDNVGGIVVDVPTTVTYIDPATALYVTVEEGTDQSLNGSSALVLACATEEYSEDVDAWRQTNIRNIIMALIEKTLSYDTDVVSALVTSALDGNITTNFDLPAIGYLASLFSSYEGVIQLYSYSGPNTTTQSLGGLVFLLENEVQWSRLMEMVKSNLYSDEQVELSLDSVEEIESL